MSLLIFFHWEKSDLVGISLFLLPAPFSFHLWKSASCGFDHGCETIICAFMQGRWENVCHACNELNSATLGTEDGRGTWLLIILMTALTGICHRKG